MCQQNETARLRTNTRVGFFRGSGHLALSC